MEADLGTLEDKNPLHQVEEQSFTRSANQIIDESNIFHLNEQMKKKLCVTNSPTESHFMRTIQR